MAPSSIPLWPDGPPGGGGPNGPRTGVECGTLSNICEPCLDVIEPLRPNGAAVLVAGGGGYTQISMAHEAYPAAGWLADQGITAFVLTYRLPGEGWADGPRVSFQDARRALRTIRARAPSMGLDRHRIGSLGFSAGGHLLAMAAVRPALRSFTARDAIDEQPARPDFAALIYPVVTLKPPFDRTSSRRQLVGDRPAAAQSAEWSVETHVRPACPPIFLVHAEDDPIVDCRHSAILEEACRRAGVPIEVHRFAEGGHGFALGRPGTPTTAWPTLARRWLIGLGVMSGSSDRILAT